MCFTRGKSGAPEKGLENVRYFSQPPKTYNRPARPHMPQEFWEMWTDRMKRTYSFIADQL